MLKRGQRLRVNAAAKMTNKSRKPNKPNSVKKQNVRVKTVEDRLCWKLVGVACLALSVFVAAALATFNWECVPSLCRHVKAQTNLIGVCGNTFAYCGFVAFGLAIWCLPVALVIGGIYGHRPRDVGHDGAHVLEELLLEGFRREVLA